MKVKRVATINDTIKLLNQIKKELTAKGVKTPGNYKVYLSSDEEGNSYGTFCTDYGFSIESDRKSIILYPCEDHLDYEEVGTH